MSKLIATFFGVGLIRPAPGTWGSAAAILPAWGLHGLFGPFGLIAATVAILVLGWWATAAYTKNKTNHDPSEVVIDEVVGQWIALWPLSFGMWYVGADNWTFPYPGWILAFLAFRAFDILKPGPVGWADLRNDTAGVMLDDVIAGLFAGIFVVLAAALAHLVIL